MAKFTLGNKHPALYRFEPVFDIGQRTAFNDGDRVFKVIARSGGVPLTMTELESLIAEVRTW